MSRRSELNSYIVRLQQRLRIKAALRGAAILVASAMGVTVVLVWLLNRWAFPAHGTVAARWTLLLILAVVTAAALVWPLIRMKRALAVGIAESAVPGLQGRLTTFYERDRENSDPFLELLAADTLEHTENAEVSTIVPDHRLFALAGAGFACLGVLLWMIAAGPGYLGYGASLLWTGEKKTAAPLYEIKVLPGDVAVRRNSDQLVVAQVKGMRPEKVQIFAHYASAPGWEPVQMQSQPDLGGEATYQFLFAGLPENVEYYATAGPLASQHYKIRVVDLPAVKSIQVTYHYPNWTGMKPVTEEHTGDLRALEGTEATIDVEMDRPLKDGQLTLDGGQSIHLTGIAGSHYQGRIHMEKDGAYHIAAVDEGQPVRLSEDYFIATDKPQPPEVAIDKPGRDYRASPIEEITVGVKAAATFGLNDVKLHYSVNGGPDKSVNMLKSPGVKEADGKYTLRLEDFKLVPGDVISMYATARDGHADARTDITFVQADPFEREFSQSQQSGGGGGGQGGNQTEMSKREKELIAQTWKQQNDKTATEKDAQAQAAFLADAQSKLRDQVMALSIRMQSRDLPDANEEFGSFEKDMQSAADAMKPSSEKLKGKQWADAIPNEQKALQYLLRAEATFRQIEVAFGQSRGGGGGGGNAGRDLASLFDLELDTEKNQYETAQTASPEEQHAKDVESALEKLDALAKRQEELAAQHDPQQSFQQRWQQEMLRREAEQLQRQMEQLAQNSQGQQGGQQNSSQQRQGSQGSSQQQGSQGGSPQQSSQSGSQSGSQSSSQQASSQGQSQNGSPAGQQQAGSQNSKQSAGNNSDQRITQALSRLRQADEMMKRSGSPQQSADAAKEAADRLREATNMLGGTQQQLASGKLGGLSQEATRLSQQERAQSDQIDKIIQEQKTSSPTDRASMLSRLKQRDQLASDRQQLSDDLSRLQKNLRDAAREMAGNQPGTAQKLRDALTQMDQSDLDNHVQRTADWLRRGIDPNSNGTEGEIAQGLQKLDQQLRQAQQGMGQGDSRASQQPRGGSGDQVAALGQVERLRSQLEAMAAAQGNRQNGQAGQQGGASGQQNANGQRRSNAMGRNGQNGQQDSAQQGQGAARQGSDQQGSGQRGGATGQNGQQGGSQQAGVQRGGANSQGQAPGTPGTAQAGGGGNRQGDPGGPNGDVRTGGAGGANGTAWGNINTGNNQYGQASTQPVPLNASGNPADTERTFQQEMRDLNKLRQMVQGDPQASREVQALTQQMQKLDPSRFPGNPAMVEQMHREVMSSVDKLELQLSRGNDANSARTGKPYVVPSGYQDSVAEYYRRLSSKQ